MIVVCAPSRRLYQGALEQERCPDLPVTTTQQLPNASKGHSGPADSPETNFETPRRPPQRPKSKTTAQVAIKGKFWKMATESE